MSNRPELSTTLFSNGFRFLKCARRTTVIFAILVAGSAGAAELLPYDPPRAANRVLQGSFPANSGATNQFDPVDRNFTRDAERLSIQEKSKLAADLRALEQKAIRERQWDAAKYYDRLLSLLNGKGP